MRYIGLTTGSNAPQAQKTFKRFEAYCATRGDGYDYSRVEYYGTSDHVTIICPKHGEFDQQPRKHEKGQGCPECSYEARGNAKALGKKAFLKRVSHFGYTYPNLSTNVKVNDIINCVCDTHGEFKQRASEQIAGCGCPNCGAEVRGIKDGNMVYLWKIPNTNIYKIGVSSVRLGDQRVKQVARAMSVDYEIIGMYEVSNAFAIEKELHNTYQILPTTLPKRDGSTEFRILGESDVNEITYYLENVVGKRV